MSVSDSYDGEPWRVIEDDQQPQQEEQPDQWAELGDEDVPASAAQESEEPSQQPEDMTEVDPQQPQYTQEADASQEPENPNDQEWDELGDETSQQPPASEPQYESEGEPHHEAIATRGIEPQEAEEEQAPENPNDQEWDELGDETSQQPPASEPQYESEGEPHHEAIATRGIEPQEAEEEQAPENPNDQQWDELGDEASQQPPASEPQHESEAEPQQAYEESAPKDQEDPNDEQWQELGDESQEQPVATRALAMPTENRRQSLVKPKSNKREIVDWEPVEYDPREGSDDEFELSTCKNPVYAEAEEPELDSDVQFKNGAPDATGEITSCFEEPNLLYRIVNKPEKTWAFYNDTTNYEMQVEFTFGKHSKIEPLENTQMTTNENGEFVTTVTVYPTETEMFIKGSPNGFTSKLRAVPLTDDYYNACNGITEEKIQEEVDAAQQVSGGSQDAEEVLQACIENNVPFVDPEFPPCQASLEAGGKKPFKHLAWARPQMYLPEEMAEQVRLFRGPVQPGVVDPGELGDSWVMCAISAVSEDPERLLGMFRHPNGKDAAQRERAVGAYRVTLSKNGWWRSVLVDSYLPVSAGKPKYARSARDMAEIWPSILEKAYAKLHGSYAKICTGDPLHALHDMTGFSSMRFDEEFSESAVAKDKSEDELFQDLTKAVGAGYTIIVNTPGKDARNMKSSADVEVAEEYKNVGLMTGHAYTILDAKAFPENDLRLVKVRNAWGRGIEWTGDWSDADDKWNQYPEIAEECKFEKADDGTFWMTWEEAHKYFNGGGICFSHTPTYDYRISCAFNDTIPSTVLEVNVETPTWVTFVISQEDRRTREDGYDYQPVMISIAQPDENDQYKVATNSTASGVHPSPESWTFLQGRDVSCITKLEPGKYMVIPRMLGQDGPASVPFVLGAIANNDAGSGDISIQFRALDKDNRVFQNFPKFFNDATPAQNVQYQKRVPGAGFPATMEGEAIE